MLALVTFISYADPTGSGHVSAGSCCTRQGVCVQAIRSRRQVLAQLKGIRSRRRSTEAVNNGRSVVFTIFATSSTINGGSQFRYPYSTKERSFVEYVASLCCSELLIGSAIGIVVARVVEFDGNSAFYLHVHVCMSPYLIVYIIYIYIPLWLDVSVSR